MTKIRPFGEIQYLWPLLLTQLTYEYNIFILFFRCPIDNGTAVFMIFIAGGQHEKEFLEEAP